MINWIIKKIKWILISTGIIGVAVASAIIPIEQPQTILQKLENKTAIERANIKGLEIAKIDFRGEHTKDDIKIDIISIKAIDDGVEVFARAWRGNKQLGFGKDGSVDIERFLIHDPEILITDPNGTIIKEWDDLDRVTGIKTHRIQKQKEDLAQATINVIAYAVSLTGKEDTNIIQEKVGNTQSIFNPVAGANSPVDGWVRETTNTASWATIIGAGGDNPAVSNTQLASGYAFKNGGLWDEVGRTFFLFDTSALGADTIDSATLSLFGVSKIDNGNQAVAIVAGTPASDDNLVAGDYTQCGSTRFASDIDITDASTSAYNPFVLNASGLANIDGGGISGFCARLSGDLDASEPSVGNAEIKLQVWMADNGSNEPKLVVEHTGVVGGAVTPPDFIIFE